MVSTLTEQEEEVYHFTIKGYAKYLKTCTKNMLCYFLILSPKVRM